MIRSARCKLAWIATVVSPHRWINNNNDDCINKALLADTDVIVTATGNVNVCDRFILDNLKSGTMVCNIGHFDNEIDTQYMRDHWYWEEIKPQVHKIQNQRSQ